MADSAWNVFKSRASDGSSNSLGGGNVEGKNRSSVRSYPL